MPRNPSAFRITPHLVADLIGAGVMCLAAQGLGRAFRLHAQRPGPELNCRPYRLDDGAIEWRAEVPHGSSVIGAGGVVEPMSPLVLVRVDGALEQRAGYYNDPSTGCMGWSDGHDTIADRLCSAFAEGDVLLVVDSPGGAAAGLQQGVVRTLAAKTKHGRRVTVFADEMIGSAATWWAMAIGDELFLPPAGEVGSIGARSGHTSLAGMLAQNGVEISHFTWPDDGKIAFADDRPLSPEARIRGDRDVALAGEAFCAAVCASPIGQRYGLDRDRVVALHADMLTGPAAVDAGLADGVASFEEVVAYALQMASTEPTGDTETRATALKITGAARAKGERAMPNVRADDEKKDEAPPSGKPGTEPDGACKACGMQNEADAKFCDQCGKSMAAERTEDDEPASSKSPDSEPESSRREGALAAPRRAQAPAKMSLAASTATILEAAADSPLAIKTAALQMRQERDWLKSTLAGITGKDDIREMVGAALNIPSRLAAGRRAATDLAKLKTAADDVERWALAHRLIATATVKRDKVLADVVADNGTRVLGNDGKPKMRIRSRYLGMDLGVLRGLVTDLEGDAPKRRRNPFEPDPARAAEAARNGAQGDRAARLEAAKKSPVAKRMLAAPTNTRTIEQIAEALVRNEDAERSASAGGGQ